MTCNKTAHDSAQAATKQGCPAVEAARADATQNPQTCPACRQFVSPNGGHFCPAEGWSKWEGSDQAAGRPEGVGYHSYVEVQLRNGEENAGDAGVLNWRHFGDEADIVHYRVVEPPEVTPDTQVRMTPADIALRDEAPLRLAQNLLVADKAVQEMGALAFAVGYQEGLNSEGGDVSDRAFTAVHNDLSRLGVEVPPADEIDQPRRNALVRGVARFYQDGMGLQPGKSIYWQGRPDGGVVEPVPRQFTITHAAPNIFHGKMTWGVEVEGVDGSFSIDGPEMFGMIENHSRPPGRYGQRETTAFHGRWQSGLQRGLPVLQMPTEPVRLADGREVTVKPVTYKEITGQPSERDMRDYNDFAGEMLGREVGWDEELPPEEKELVDAAYSLHVEAHEGSDLDFIRGNDSVDAGNDFYTVLSVDGQKIGVIGFRSDELGDRIGWGQVSIHLEPDYRDDPHLLEQALEHGMAAYSERYHIGRFVLTRQSNREIDETAKQQLSSLGFKAGGGHHGIDQDQSRLSVDLTGEMIISDRVNTAPSDTDTLNDLALNGRPRFIPHPNAMADAEEHYFQREDLKNNAVGGHHANGPRPSANEFVVQMNELARTSPANPAPESQSREYRDGYYDLARDAAFVLKRGGYTDTNDVQTITQGVITLSGRQTPEMAASTLNRFVEIAGDALHPAARDLVKIALRGRE